jgi:HD-GYP domain-containing protein (c-di-GMP phosphodiesterase class II)
MDLGGGYMLRRLIDLHGTLRPVHATIQRVFIIAGAIALIGVIVLTWVSSRVIVEPIGRVVRHLRQSERTGTLSEFDATTGTAAEVRELMVGFNRAASAIRAGQENLHTAYVQFVQSLASALDARDPYTAGHSGRVCRFACTIASSMNFDRDSLRTIAIGALLHDIGKIGIRDVVLQKPGRLTDDEFALIKQHPTIGRRILESVNGFTPYLDVVELHHENWDGTGYPHGLRGEEVPLSARIVHVADAYDAMTSGRPYRRGMTQEVTFRILRENAGTQFDPAVVNAFVDAWRSGDLKCPDEYSSGGFAHSLQYLAYALQSRSSQVVLEEVRTERSRW